MKNGCGKELTEGIAGDDVGIGMLKGGGGGLDLTGDGDDLSGAEVAAGAVIEEGMLVAAEIMADIDGGAGGGVLPGEHDAPDEGVPGVRMVLFSLKKRLICLRSVLFLGPRSCCTASLFMPTSMQRRRRQARHWLRWVLSTRQPPVVVPLALDLQTYWRLRRIERCKEKKRK